MSLAQAEDRFEARVVEVMNGLLEQAQRERPHDPAFVEGFKAGSQAAVYAVAQVIGEFGPDMPKGAMH